MVQGSLPSTTAEPSPGSNPQDAYLDGALPLFACEQGLPVAGLERSCVLHHDGAGWSGVRPVRYAEAPGGAEGVSRRVLAAPPAAAFELRYLEIDPGGHGHLEHHARVRVVFCQRGRGRVVLGDRPHELGAGDVVYVAPGDAHQFHNPYAEPFGFLCIVDRERDRPVPSGE